MGEGATYVELKGTFRFAVNQSGLDYHNKKERKAAVEDFENLLQEFLDKVNDMSYASIDCDFNKIKVSEGEY